MPFLSIQLVSRVHADTPYSLNPVPAFAQEGSTVSLVLTVKFISSTTTTNFQFRFFVRDPSGVTSQSQLENYTTLPGQYQFSILVAYPSVSIRGSNWLTGQYAASVDQLAPVASPNVASTVFVLSITDNPGYERTQTVNLQASGYNSSENVGVTVRTQTSSTIVFSRTIAATPYGIVSASWKIPLNATIDNYVVSLTGTSTRKAPPDVQTFSVRVALMTIAGISSLKVTYQRTETMRFSFQPTYPDGSISSTGVALLTLARPSGAYVTLTATYDSVAQAFNATYRTSLDNQTGTWTASLSAHGYSDAYGNIGPGLQVTNSPQLVPAALAISVDTSTSITVGQQLKFNASITYPDGTVLKSGTVRAYLVYSGTPVINDTVPVVFDTGLGLWVGTYTARTSDSGGLWSLIVTASDTPTPSNTGSATRAITIQNNTGQSGNVSFPLYYFGIIAALIAGLLVAAFLAFRRRRVTHAKLKIDLEAVRSEAGRIESQDFFKSIKEQVAKDEEH